MNAFSLFCSLALAFWSLSPTAAACSFAKFDFFVSTFEELADAVNTKVCSNGKQYTLTVSLDLVFDSEISIKFNQNVKLIGLGHTKRVLTATSTRHIRVETGAIFEAENLAFTNGKGKGVNNNDFGGALYSKGTISLISCSFYANEAFNGGGAVSSFDGSVTVIRDCKFENNKATSDISFGGALRIKYSVVGSIERTSFISNSVGYKGGGISLNECQVGKLIGNSFSKNTCGEAGGGLRIYKSTFQEIAANTFLENEANYGGGLFIRGTESKDLTIKDSFFRENKGNYGGAMRLSYAQIHSIVNTSFVANDGVLGGGIEVYSSTITEIKDSVFKQNRAHDLDLTDTINPICYGGAIKNNGIIKRIDSCTFEANEASHYGPDIYAAAEGTTLVRDTNFLSVEEANKPRVTGPLLTCSSHTTLALCFPPNERCLDKAGYNSQYGIQCGLSCERGYFGIAPNKCEPCGAGKFASNIAVLQDDACELCPKGRFNAISGQSSCAACPTGKYAAMGASMCLQLCRRGQEPISKTVCRDCDPGTFSNVENGGKCSICKDGYVAATSGSGYCDRCPEGTFSNAARTACEACPQNTFSLGGTMTCTACNEGARSPPGATRCSSCEPGHEFLNSSANCNVCPAGSERPYGSSACAWCQPGFISSQGGSPYCEQCPGGTFANPNATACLPCPAGHYCPPGSSVPTRCTDASTYCAAGSPFPRIVEAGNYSNALRTTSTPCEPGHFCLHGVKAKCPENTFASAKGMTSNMCEGSCSAAVFAMSESGATQCSCMPTFVSMNRDDGIFACSCNETASKHPTRAECVPCPHGTLKSPETLLCVAKSGDTVMPLIVGAVCAILILGIAAALFWKRTKSMKRAINAIASGIGTHVAAFTMELADFAADVIVCVHVFNAEGEVKKYKSLYAACLGCSSCGFVVAIFLRVKAVLFHISHQNYIQVTRRGKRFSALDVAHRGIITMDLKRSGQKLTTETYSRMLEYVNMELLVISMHVIVLVLEDLPSGGINFYVLMKQIKAHAAIDPYMLLSLLFSVASGVHKISKVAKVPKLWKDADYFKDLIALACLAAPKPKPRTLAGKNTAKVTDSSNGLDDTLQTRRLSILGDGLMIKV